MKSVHEVEAINRFIEFLKVTRGVDYRVAAENVVVDPATGSNYDYQLVMAGAFAPAVAVEIFRLVESEAGMAAESHLGRLWKEIKSEFLAAGLTDLLVRTPFRSPVFPRDAVKFAKALAQMALKELAAHPKSKEVELEGSFALERIEGLRTVACSTNSGARWIDGVGIATTPLTTKLTDKDGQLAVDGLERVILCVNWAWAVDHDDAAHAIALMNVSNLRHVDRVYFDTGKAHHLVYARRVRDTLDRGEQVPTAPDEKNLFEQSVRVRLEKDVAGSFELVRRLSEAAGGVSWISDRHVREALARAADKKVGAGDVRAGLWAVAKLRDDPDPPLENYPDDADGTFNYHEQVKRGVVPSTSVGVRAAVCWLIQKLICKAPNDCWQLIEDVEKLATGSNLYVRQNACVPLIEFAVRARWKEGGQYLMPAEIRTRTRALAFRMLRENQPYPAILNWLAHVFAQMPNLDSTEARDVLEVLLANTTDEGLQDAVQLLVFFAVFRAGPPGFPGEFDGSFARAWLDEALARGRDELRSSIAFVLFKTVEEDPKHALPLKRYILMLSDVAASDRTSHFFFEMADPLLELDPDGGIEGAIVKVIAAEAKRCATEGGRYFALFEIVPLLKKLADRRRWATVAQAVEAIAAAAGRVIGASELRELLGHAPPEFATTIAGLRLDGPRN